MNWFVENKFISKHAMGSFQVARRLTQGQPIISTVPYGLGGVWRNSSRWFENGGIDPRITIPKTKIAPVNVPFQKEISSSNHPFSGAGCSFQGGSLYIFTVPCSISDTLWLSECVLNSNMGGFLSFTSARIICVAL